MANSVTIAVDVNGGDQGVDVSVPASLAMLRREMIEPFFRKHRAGKERVRIEDAREIVEMCESPVDALRKKKNSSMRVAINLVKDGEADACISAGNTGALMATARFVLKTVPGIDRPAIMAVLPTKFGRTYMLDLGANTNCTSEQLFQFAIMGTVVVSGIEDIAQPRVALLNIGVEDIKGNDTVRGAANLLSNSDLNYVGFVEGDAIPDQKADVIVCDGFSGNVALKTMEGTAQLVRHFLLDEFRSGLYGRIAGLIAWPVLRSLSKRVDPRRYNGASLVGLNGIVIKSHGSADQVAYQQALHTAMVEVEKRVPEQIRSLMDQQSPSQ